MSKLGKNITDSETVGIVLKVLLQNRVLNLRKMNQKYYQINSSVLKTVFSFLIL